MPEAAVILDVRALTRRFPVRGGHGAVHAVDDVTFAIGHGESVGLVGESGCGKSTVVRLVTRLDDPTDGRIFFEGHDVGAIPAKRFARTAARGRIQMVFQDPADSLNPRFTAFDTIADPMRRLGESAMRARLRDRVHEVADLCGLPAELLGRYPHQLSGGQQQRVGIARAIALEPRLLVLDEPTSALDVSVQAVILHLLADLRQRLGMSYLFVSHDLNVVRMLTDRVLVMYLGRIVEQGPADVVFEQPAHPYTRALLSAVPADGGGPRSRICLTGEPRSPIDPSPTVCRFHGRCPEGFERCEREMPVLRAAGAGRDHEAACHLLDAPVGSAVS
ncbi:MAG: ABC transporter ATP-binding protein [Candidatus Rokubacteria bacterium]|nr:ABC transporter ATP-binding protein [Candidatus Rokubacteria bacterium]